MKNASPITLKILGPLVLIIASLVVAALLLNGRAKRALTRLQAETLAQVVANQVVTDRKHYVQSVVGEVKGGPHAPIASGGFVAGSARVPLPAEFIGRVAKDVADSQTTYSYRLVSRWNVNLENSLDDAFLKSAFADLLEQEKTAKSEGKLSAENAYAEWRPFFRYVREDKPILRYVIADPAAAGGCVSCHNTLEQDAAIANRREQAGVEAGKEFELNDLMGAIEVKVNLDQVTALTTASTRQFLWWMGAISLAILALCSLLVNKGLISPLNHFARRARLVADGDLSRQGGGGGVIGGVFDELSRISSSLGGLVAQVQKGTKPVSRAADSLTRVSEQLGAAATGGKQQAAVMMDEFKTTSGGIAAMRTASEEVTENVSSVARTTGDMKENVSDISDQAQNVSQTLQDMAAAIEQLSASAQEISVNCGDAASANNAGREKTQSALEKLAELEGAIGEISSVLTVIRKVTDDTNLLALNASIEAARAGEAGKGFGVVATGIKALSEQTTAATVDINKQIGEIQEQSAEAASSVRELAEAINHSNSLSGQIASASEQQTQVTQNLAQIGAGAAESAHSISESLRTLLTAARELDRNTEDASTGMARISSAATAIEEAMERLRAVIARVNSGAGQTEESATTVADLAESLKPSTESLNAAIRQFTLAET